MDRSQQESFEHAVSLLHLNPSNGSRRGVGLDEIGLEGRHVRYAKRCSSLQWRIRTEYDPWLVLSVDHDTWPPISYENFDEFRRLYFLTFGPSALEYPSDEHGEVPFGTCVIGGFVGTLHRVGVTGLLVDAFKAGHLGSSTEYDGRPTYREWVYCGNSIGVVRHLNSLLGRDMSTPDVPYPVGSGLDGQFATTSLTEVPRHLWPDHGVKWIFDTGTRDPRDPRTWQYRHQPLMDTTGEVVVYYLNDATWVGMNKRVKDVRDLTVDCWPRSQSPANPSTGSPGGSDIDVFRTRLDLLENRVDNLTAHLNSLLEGGDV